jgi:uncharacterized protein (DUF362 family)
MQILKQDTYQLDSIPPIFWEGFPLVKNKTIFLKPNLVSPHSAWDSNSTTDVRIVEMVINKLIREEAARIWVGDCGFKDQWDLTIKSTGYDKLPEKYPVDLIPLQDGPNFHKFTLKRLEQYHSLFGAKFSDYVLECDIVINIPKMKVHNMALVTGAIKNMMGIMAQKGSMHPRGNSRILHRRLADLYQLSKPLVQYVVMDGIIGQEYSEQCGIPVQSGVLLSGKDSWEIDVAAARLMGIDPKRVSYLNFINAKAMDTVHVPKNLVKEYELPLAYR